LFLIVSLLFGILLLVYPVFLQKHETNKSTEINISKPLKIVIMDTIKLQNQEKNEPKPQPKEQPKEQPKPEKVRPEEPKIRIIPEGKEPPKELERLFD